MQKPTTISTKAAINRKPSPTRFQPTPHLANHGSDLWSTHDDSPWHHPTRPQLNIPTRIFYGNKDIAFSQYGEYWRQIKSIAVLQYLLSNKRVQSYQHVRFDEMCRMMNKILGANGVIEEHLNEKQVGDEDRDHVDILLEFQRDNLKSFRLERDMVKAIIMDLFTAGTDTTFTSLDWAITRDPSKWEEPEEFRPERFLNSPIDYKGFHFELIPFGAGRRGRPGIEFAMNVNKLVLANLVYKFDLELVGEEGFDMNETNGITVHKKLPILVSATTRFK
ncbi:hypothetical protein E3N88_10798 [Mikania micrantha]|uniref:Cytochrome P450 n=1 Tax=Mikania micrantha TaxID=192012 RepID=A0A5N6PDW5_9ASTR|nr:hypothetical protein E3N88_10798 [Mikania micrantha]